MKVLALRKKFVHMGDFSGYDVLFKQLEKNVDLCSVWDKRPFNTKELLGLNSQPLISAFGKPLSKGLKGLYQKWFLTENQRILLQYTTYLEHSSEFYYDSSFVAEWSFLTKALNTTFDIAFMGYVENNLGLLTHSSIRRTLKCPLVGTIHQPMSWWKLHLNINLLESLDHIIVLTEHERKLWSEYYPGKVTCIPHGVCSDFYIPKDITNKNNQSIIFVGLWLRDLKALAEVAKRVINIKPNIIFNLVIPLKSRRSPMFQNSLYELAKLENIKWHDNIDDDALLSLYQESSLAFLPLIDCTANNAIMEALSCGKPIVTTNVESIYTYLDETNAKFHDREDYKGMTSSILQILEDFPLAQQMGDNSRKKALEFNWDNIVTDFITVFKRIQIKNTL